LLHTKEHSLAAARGWLAEMKGLQPATPVVLCGTKCDDAEHRKVSPDDCTALAKEFGVPYRETSAKTGEGVAELVNFIALLAACYMSEKEREEKRGLKRRERKK